MTCFIKLNQIFKPALSPCHILDLCVGHPQHQIFQEHVEVGYRSTNGYKTETSLRLRDAFINSSQPLRYQS